MTIRLAEPFPVNKGFSFNRPNFRRKVSANKVDIAVRVRYDMHAAFGGMAERFNAAVLKTVVSEAIPQVRILLPPPNDPAERCWSG